ncbi:uncharacterized protein si:dkey-28a3.2 isoform X2 [Megalobrama amblycephala]|uniref:uncharacterized protein si:dkey-28a3.2 isoform X2 n=1 Tax=Megalobrama amblycephala TaxID=75352 RepID=UPI002013FAB6|nr:uncharacterized protein si:dkey-28a3.2 isoform X2 [Megalobrama amblycephala]
MKDVTPQKSCLEQVLPCLRRCNPVVDVNQQYNGVTNQQPCPARLSLNVVISQQQSLMMSLLPAKGSTGGARKESRGQESHLPKKKIGNENLGLCMSVVSDEPALQIPKVDNDPSLHNHEISCKLEDTDAPRNSSSSGLSVSECNVTMVSCQKERWFQKTKLNHVLPKFPETSTNSLKGVIGNKRLKSSFTGSSNTDAKTESFCPIGHSVTTTCIELHSKSTHTQKTKTGMSSLNSKQLATSPQSHVSMVLPMHNNQNMPQICLRPLTSAECKVHKEQSLVHSHIAKRRTCAFASKHNTTMAMTEEEMAAKRRENWRIKKREQRAKRAAKLARDREGSLGQGQSSCIMNASSPANSKALRGISFNSANPKCLNQQSFGVKCIASRTQLHVQDTKPNHASLSSGILQPSSSKSKVPQFAHTQKRHCQEPTKKFFLGASKVESPEDRHARQKEYWRIKKREQRARLSTVVKAQLKEQSTLKHCGRRYHNSFNQMCGVQVNRAGAFTSSSDKIGGFIKEDGMVTVSTSKTTSESSLPGSHDYSNVKCVRKVRLQVQVHSPLYSDAQPVTKLISPPCNISKAHHNSLVKSSLAGGAVMGSMTVTIQSEAPTEEERIARLREYWRIKKREQRASRAARLGNGLLRSKVSVLKQREQNKKSNKRDSITSSITKTGAPTPIKEEHINPPIDAVFSIPEITPCISAIDGKPSPCPTLKSHIEPPAAANHHATTLQAVASMKKLLEESVSTPEDSNATKMHVKCENEPLWLTKDDLTSEDAKLNITLQQYDLLEHDVSEDTSLIDFKMSPQTFPFEDTSHHKSHNFCQEAADGSHDFSPVAVQPQCINTQKFSDDGADPKQSCPSQASQKKQLGESDELQRKREYWRLMKRKQRARKANKDAAKDANKTEEERIARLREYWMIKKREQRASQAARLRNGLLRSKVSVLKQREQNKKSNKRESITSSITTTVAPSSAPTHIQEHINPPIHALFSIPEITLCISVKDGKPSPCPSLESHIEPAATNHHATTLQAVASMKKLLEESVCTPEDNNATEMHVKCENEPLLLTKDDLLTSEDAKPNVTLQQNVLLECGVSEDTSLKDIKMSPQAFPFEDTSHHKSHNLCQEAADRSHDFSPVAVQPQCINTQKFSDDGADPKQSCPSQASQKQQHGESDELQRKREYWRLMKRQQRAKKANKDAVLHSLVPQTQTPSTTLLLAMSQDTSACRKIPIQKQTRRCTKPAGPQAQLRDKSRTNKSQIVAKPNPQVDPQEVIRRRRMQWRIKKQKQRARKAANERKLRQAMLPPQGQTSGQNITSFCSTVVQSIKSEDQLDYLAEPCQTALKEESSFAPNDATEGPLSQAEWRNVYLMDSDPVNLLLVCMVCGEQQYSLSVEAAKAHIEEVHPNTISLGELEREGILDAWDKQVAVREHSITHQLQQRCSAPTEFQLPG